MSNQNNKINHVMRKVITSFVKKIHAHVNKTIGRTPAQKLYFF